MRSVVWIFILLVLAVGGYLYFADTAVAPTGEPNIEEMMQQYQNTTYGISLAYPNTYALQEREVGNGERAHYSITLIDKVALANAPQNGEGPPAITIDIFQNDIDQLLINEWVQGSSFSNFKLSPDGVLASTTLAGAPALTYTWDGLYRGKSFVAAHKGNIVMVSGQFLAAEDEIVSDFNAVVSSLKLY